jgi:hypothetical protein
MLPDADRLVGLIRQLGPTDGTEQELLPFDPARVMVLFSGSGLGGGLIIRVYRDGTSFLPLALATDDTLELWYDRHGPLVGGRFTVVGPPAGPIVHYYDLRYTG